MARQNIATLDRFRGRINCAIGFHGRFAPQLAVYLSRAKRECAERYDSTRLDGSSNRCSDRSSLVYPIVSCGFTYTLLAIHDVPFLINTEVSSTARRLWQLRFSLSLPLAVGLPKPLPPQPGSHQASMNRSIFGYGVAARPIEGVGSRMKRGREYRGLLLRECSRVGATAVRETMGVSWPEWCFPGVSTSIYLPGAYSDKSVIAAEASERVARHTTSIATTTRVAGGTARHLAGATKTGVLARNSRWSRKENEKDERI